jgi:MtN3 and saliva related transmembrane protein
MIDSLTPWFGALAATHTSLSYLPTGAKDAAPRIYGRSLLENPRDLTSGLLLWLVYGLLKQDWVLVVANAVGAALSASVVECKLRDLHFRH